MHGIQPGIQTQPITSGNETPTGSSDTGTQTYLPTPTETTIGSSLTLMERQLSTSPAVSQSPANISGASFFNPDKNWGQFADDIDTMATNAAASRQSMPCMKETADTIASQVESFASNPGLPTEDSEALNKYLDDIRKLEDEGYPYAKSLQLALQFPLIQDIYYFQVVNHASPDTQEKIKTARLHRMGELWSEGIIGINGKPCLKDLLRQDWSNFYGEEGSKELIIFIRGILGGQGTVSNDMGAIQQMLANKSLKKLYVPTFAPLSLAGLNLMHYSALVPVGLTTEVYEHHDRFNMSPTFLAYHDLWHETFINSGIISEDHKRSQSHHAITQFYQLKDQVEPEVFRAAEMILFEHCHENTRRERSLTRLTSPSTCIEQASRVHLRLTRDWEDLDDSYKKSSTVEYLAKGALWVSIIMQSQLNIDPNQTAGDPLTQFQAQWSSLEEKKKATEGRLQRSPGRLRICRDFSEMGVKLDKTTMNFYRSVADQLEQYGLLLLKELHV